MLLLPIPCVSYAAGLGQLVVLSSLGQPFRAQIGLLGRPQELINLNSRLAPSDAYRQFEGPYTPAVADLSLDLKQSSGQPYLEVTSGRSINDLYIYFLVEIQSGSIRLVRGYTALIDPAGIGPGPAASSLAAVRETPPAAVSRGSAGRTVATVVADKPAAKSGQRVVHAPRGKPRREVAVDAPESPALLNQIRGLEERSVAQKRDLADRIERIASMEKSIQVMQQLLDSAKPADAPAEVRTQPEPPSRIPEPARTESVAAPKPESAPIATKREEPKTALPQEKPAPHGKPDRPNLKTTAPAAKPGLFDSISGVLLYVAGGGIAILLCGLLAYWIKRRRPSPQVTPEEVLIKLLARNPEREDLHLKLLEIYYARGDGAAFHAAAALFKKLTDVQGGNWRQVATMGIALERGNPLYYADLEEESTPAPTT